MADTFGLKIGLEGEKEFKKALSDINQSFKVLGSEMKLVYSQFDKNDSSAEALAAKHKVLSKEIDQQKEKIEMLKKALQNATESFGENDRRTQQWQIQLNNAQASLNDMERELQETEDAADDLSEELEESADAAEKSGDRFKNLGSILKTVGAAMSTVVVAAGAAAIKLGTEVVQQFGELEQNLGGSVAVFGEYASEIQRTGEEAYKNLGLSQSEYLATANKMGALFQGSGISQQKSLELTTQAMQRAADMASVTPWYTATPSRMTMSSEEGSVLRYPFQYNSALIYSSSNAGSMAVDVSAEDHIPAAFVFTYVGGIINPKLILKGTDSGKVYGTCALNLTMSSGDTLEISTKYGNSYVTVTDSNGKVTDAVAYLDLAYEPFPRIPIDEDCTLHLSADEAVEGTATVRVYY